MVSFEVTLDPVNWTEVLVDGFYVAFDLVAAPPVEIYFTVNADTPTVDDNGTLIHSYPSSWDYEGLGFEVAEQRVWVRGKNIIRGVRA